MPITMCETYASHVRTCHKMRRVCTALCTHHRRVYVGRLWRAIQKETLSLHTRLPCHSIYT